MTTPGTFRWLALAVAALGVPGLYGQARVALVLDGDEAYAGEPIIVNVEVRDFKDCGQPVFPDLADCEVQFLGIGADHRATRIINGRVTRSRSLAYRYELIPRKTGVLVIPAVSVEVDGKTLETRPQRIRVRESNRDELMAVEIRCESERIYVGQLVKLTLAIWVKPAITLGRKLPGRSMFSAIDFQRSSLEPFPRNQQFTLSTHEWTAADGSTADYYVYEVSTEWVADRPGPLTFDDVHVTMYYPTAFGRDVFGDVMVRKRRTLRIRAKVAATEVLLPPAEGRPRSFTGAVGQFRIATTAEPASARVGDPIELKIQILGKGPLDTLPPPPLAANTRLTESFHVPRESLAGQTVRKRRWFSQVIRAKHGNVTEVPPIEYPYFDPYREEYVVARSAAIPLAITAAESLDPSELTRADAPSRDSARGARDSFDGLLGNETSEDRLLVVTPFVRASHVIAVTAGPPVLFLGTWGCLVYVQRRGNDIGRRRRGNALRSAHRRIDDSRVLPPRDAAREIGVALAGYLADRLNQPGARYAGRAGVELLEQCGVDEEARRLWLGAIESCEAASFAGDEGTDDDDLWGAARDCVTRIEREGL